MGTTQLHLRLNDDPLPERPPEPVKPEPQPARQPAAGFTIIPDAILRRTDLSPMAKLAYARIKRYEGMGEAFPAIPSIAAALGTGDRNCRKVVGELLSAGLLSRHERSGFSNVYRTAPLQDISTPDPCTIIHPPLEQSFIPPLKDRSGEGCKIVPTNKQNKKQLKKQQKKDRAAAPAVVFPESLDCEEFKARWEEYLAYRGDRRLPKLLPSSVNKQLGQLASYPLSVVLAAIDKTIASGWQGIFPDKARMPSTAVAPVAGKYDHLN